MEMTPYPPDPGAHWLVGEMAYVHGLLTAPACVIAKVRPAMVGVPMRAVVAVFAATE